MDFKKLYKLLTEAPISDMQFIGNWDKKAPLHGYDKASAAILSSPVAVEKIKNMWNKSDKDFDLYFVRGPNLRQYSETGEVDEEFIRKTFNLPSFKLPPDHIAVFYVNNAGDEKVPMTGWVLAHRFAHSLSRGNKETARHHFNEFRKTVIQIFNEVLQYGYDYRVKEDNYSYSNTPSKNPKIYNEVAMAIGTFKSARDHNLRNYQEFMFELIAQYIINGEIKLNKTVPSILPISHAWGKPQGLHRVADVSEVEEILYTAENTLNIEINSLLGTCYNGIFVM